MGVRSGAKIAYENSATRIRGHLGAVIDGEAYGWALDPEQPGRSLEVTAYINCRPVCSALAGYYRPDVAERLTCSGRHGFYIDLTPYSDRGRPAIIDIRLSDGTPLDGCPVRAAIPCAAPRSRPALLFMHIAKTGGTALREAITANFRQGRIAYLYPDVPGFPIRDLKELPLQQRSALQLVVGHFQYGVHDAVPGASSYATVVREPLCRVWSHYNYMVQRRDAAILSGGRALSLGEALESGATVNLDNLMVRCFGGIDEEAFPPGSMDKGAFELARQNCDRAFAYVGLQERLDEAYSALSSKFQWAGAAPAVVNRGDYGGAGCSEREEALVRHFNRWDFQLYEHITKSSGKAYRTAAA